MLRPRERTGRAATAAGAAALAIAWVVSACTGATDAPQSPSGAAAEPVGAEEPAPPASERPLHNANHDRRSFDNQPDYEGEAALLRDYVEPRLAASAIGARALMCARMLDTAAEFYAAVEREPAQREQVLAALKASRADDLARCQRETSPRAAACVTILLGDRTAEFPWLLDQCSRAYPAG
ncbi:MAG TPA: hypothetical protein PKW35_22415 [Nannocystaceae bacterium]|nr:hypothetical protein [Nannocystaceae bacterium]